MQVCWSARTKPKKNVRSVINPSTTVWIQKHSQPEGETTQHLTPACRQAGSTLATAGSLKHAPQHHIQSIDKRKIRTSVLLNRCENLWLFVKMPCEIVGAYLHLIIA